VTTTTQRIASAFLLFLVSGFASAQTVLNPSFETAGQANWTPVLGGCSSWADLATTPPTTNGANGVESNQGCPSSQILYQDVTLPSTGTYTIRVDAGCTPLGGNNTDFCRVDVTDTSASSINLTTPGATTVTGASAGVIVNLFSSDGSLPPAAQTGRGATFNGTAGQVIRIRFLVQASNNPVIIALDNVAMAFSPTVPTMSEWALILMALLLAVTAAYKLRRR
jgi:hypothetical protein